MALMVSLSILTRFCNKMSHKNFLIIVSLFSIFSCATPYQARDGKISLLNSADKNSFSFSVSEEFTRANVDSEKDKKNPLITKAESSLLIYLLKQKNYCLQNGR